MSQPVVYIALSQFCEQDSSPRRHLEAAGFAIRANTSGRRLTRAEMIPSLEGADAVIAGVEAYEAALFAALPRLRCISRCGAGTDSIDLEAARRHGVEVFITRDEVVQPVAELTLAMMLALARHLPKHLVELREGHWAKHTGFLLSEWTVAIVGFGAIGRRVAELLRGFGCRLLVVDPYVEPGGFPPRVQRRELVEALSEADVVTLHVTRPREQGWLLGEEEFRRMKSGARLINTARGYLLDEAALLESLRSGHLAGAALDVFGQEPYAGPLTKLPQVLCTPHVASLTRASRAAMERRCVEHVIAWWASQPATVTQLALAEGSRGRGSNNADSSSAVQPTS